MNDMLLLTIICAALAAIGFAIMACSRTDAQKRQRRRDKLRRLNEASMRRELQRFFHSRR